MHLTAITPNVMPPNVMLPYVMLPNVMLSAIRSEAENEVEARGGFPKSLHWVRTTKITAYPEQYAVLLTWFDYASLRSAALTMTGGALTLTGDAYNIAGILCVLAGREGYS